MEILRGMKKQREQDLKDVKILSANGRTVSHMTVLSGRLGRI
jgi:hypothetical protein